MGSTSDSELRVRTGATELRLGVIDCLSAGFEKVNGMLWIVLLPVLLGFFLWQGPQLSAGPAFAQFVNWYSAVAPEELESHGAGMDMPSRQMMETLVGETNLFSFLTVGAGIAGRGTPPAAAMPGFDRLASVKPLDQPAQAAVAILGIYLLGLLLGAAYLTPLAQKVRGDRIDLARLGRRVWSYWLSIVGFLLLVGIAALAISLPVAFLLGLAFAFAPVAAELIFWAVVAGWQVAAIWLALFTFFVVDGAIVGELGPIGALRSSIMVVGRNFWSAAGLIALYLLITYGMMALWGQLGDSPVARVVAILGNAYVGTGLAAGSMVFYRTRTAASARVEHLAKRS